MSLTRKSPATVSGRLQARTHARRLALHRVAAPSGTAVGCSGKGVGRVGIGRPPASNGFDGGNDGAPFAPASEGSVGVVGVGRVLFGGAISGGSFVELVVVVVVVVEIEVAVEHASVGFDVAGRSREGHAAIELASAIAARTTTTRGADMRRA